MAALILRRYRERRLLRRNRIFRDRRNPFDIFDDDTIFNKYRFRRQDLLDITDSISDGIELSNRLGSLTPLLQVLITIRFYACGSFQDVCGEIIGVSQATTSRTVKRVTEALLRQAPIWIKLPTQQEADRQKVKFFEDNRFPNVFGCIDGTQIRIQAPSEYEHEFVNRKNYHAINVQVICDADLMFINCVAKWPGSVHDARILRESPIFDAFERNHARPVDGFILGDSGYMLRDWLLTPVANPATAKERAYNYHHSSARAAVERAIGILKRRWHCLNRLRLGPVKACQVITVCVMLSNRARLLNLNNADGSDSDDESGPDDRDSDSDDNRRPGAGQLCERTRTEAGKAVRATLINNVF